MQNPTIFDYWTVNDKSTFISIGNKNIQGIYDFLIANCDSRKILSVEKSSIDRTTTEVARIYFTAKVCTIYEKIMHRKML